MSHSCPAQAAPPERLLAAYLAAQHRFDPMHNDLGALALYELAHAEADRALPDWYLYRLRDLGWEQGSKRERNSQLQRLHFRPFSTRFG